jgi:hypothetical protein
MRGASRNSKGLKIFIDSSEKNPTPGAVFALQTFGDFLGFNPHCHVLVTDGCFYGKGMFRVAPSLEMKKLEAIFRHKVFKMLLAKGRNYQRPDRPALQLASFRIPGLLRESHISER